MLEIASEHPSLSGEKPLRDENNKSLKKGYRG